jgi:hypothetical protein
VYPPDVVARALRLLEKDRITAVATATGVRPERFGSRVPARRPARSDDIKQIFCRHLDLLGIAWTKPNDKSIAIARRREVAKLDAFVGPKR